MVASRQSFFDRFLRSISGVSCSVTELTSSESKSEMNRQSISSCCWCQSGERPFNHYFVTFFSKSKWLKLTSIQKMKSDRQWSKKALLPNVKKKLCALGKGLLFYLLLTLWRSENLTTQCVALWDGIKYPNSHKKERVKTRGYRKRSPKPSKRTELLWLETLSLPFKWTEDRTSGFNAQTSVYTKDRLKSQEWFFATPPPPTNLFVSLGFCKLLRWPLNGSCAHYVMISKSQSKPFWLGTRLYPQTDWQKKKKKKIQTDWLGDNFAWTMT